MMVRYFFLILLMAGISKVSEAQHTLILKSGERMNGELTEYSSGKVTFNFKGSAMKFELDEISAIMFGDKQQTSGAVSVYTDDNPGAKVSADTKGVFYTMPGRILVRQPTVNNLTEKRGVVVVEIAIDKYGNIIDANPGAEGTTTNDTYLHTKAKQAAESAKFDENMVKPLKETGTMTITF